MQQEETSLQLPSYFHHTQSPVRTSKFKFHSPKSQIPNPKSQIPNPQSLNPNAKSKPKSKSPDAKIPNHSGIGVLRPLCQSGYHILSVNACCLRRFLVQFHFAPNPFFHDKVLEKELLLPHFGAPLHEAVEGRVQEINWKGVENNLTVKVSAKALKAKAKVRKSWESYLYAQCLTGFN